VPRDRNGGVNREALWEEWAEEGTERCMLGLREGFDLEGFLENRRYMRMYLGRYGRQNVLQWGDSTSIELAGWFWACDKLLKSEAKAGGSDDVFDP
jgi:hypothetical protein